MNHAVSSALRGLVLVAVGAFLAPGSLFAVDHEVRILLDLDNNAATGCTVPTVEGPFDGVEQILITTVETTSPPPAGTVTDVATSDCINPATDTFGPPASFDGGWPIGIDNGEGGLDVVETYFPLLSSVVPDPKVIRVAVVVSDELGGQQALLTEDGTPDGPAILVDLRSLLEIPTLGEWGLILLALLLAGSSIALLGRRGAVAAAAALLLLGGGLAWAAPNLDGLVDDWFPQDRVAGNGIVLWAKKVGNDLCFQVDLELLFNNPPDAVDDSFTGIAEDSSANPLDVLANDTDPGDTFTITSVGATSDGGTVAIVGGGTSLEYTPAPNFFGTETFSYTITDTSGATDTANVSVTVDGVNDAPTADDDAFAVAEGGTLNQGAPGVLDGDTDPESDPLTAILMSGPSNASSFTLNPNGSFDYTHDGSETTSDSFTYKANDGALDSNVATVTITINAVNDAPTADDDAYGVDEGGTLNQAAAGGVLDGDTDPESDPLTAILVSGPSNASSFTLNSDGSFGYTHDGSETTSDSFTYKANDGALDSNTATVTITINAVNDAPTADDDAYAVAEGGTLNQGAPGVLDGDTDPESDPLTAILVSGPSNASSFTLNPNGSFDYTHDGSETTSDSFTYKANDGALDSNVATVTITINPVNDPPVADDDAYGVAEGGTVSDVAPGVLAGDTDAEGQPLQALLVTGPSHASSFTLNTDGSFSYTHDGTETPLVDSFTYKANDGSLDSNVATVTITITPVNDAPILDLDADDSGGTGGADYAITFNDGDPAQFLEDVADATITDADNPTLTTLTVTLTNLLDSGDEVLDVDLTGADPSFSKTYDTTTDPNQGVLTITTSTIGGRAIAEFVALLRKVTYLNSDDDVDTTSRIVQFVANDGTSPSNTATTTVTVVAVNDAPTADDDAYGVDEGATLNQGAPGVLDGDTDPEGDSLTAVLDSGPANATSFTLNPDGSFDYTHDGSETTSDSFTYHANDGGLDSNVATVTITINAVNDAPVAVADSATVDEGGTVTVLDSAATSVLANDTDAESDPLTAVLVSGPTNESAFTLNNDGTFSYTHDGSETTSDSFTYKANDGSLDSNTVTVSITVNAVNDAPVAVADSATVDEGGAVSVLDSAATSVLANDTDAESDPLTAVLVTGPTNESSFTLNSDGTFSYTHDGSETTSDSFTYKANDGALDSNTVTVNITINAVNDAPVAVADSATVDEGGTVSVLDSAATSVLANDTDAESDPLTAVLVTGPANASSFTLNNDGTFSYTHNGGETTSDSFTYKANDGALDSNTVTVSITINPVNDPPVANPDTADITEEAPNVAAPNTVAGNVLTNDTDPDSVLSVSAVNGVGGNVGNPVAGTYGSVTINSNGSFTYSLDDANPTVNGLAPGQMLTDAFGYTASDGALTSTSTLTVTIHGADDPATPDDDAFDFLGNTELEVDCVGGDCPEATTPKVSAATPPVPAAFGVLDGDVDPDGGPAITISEIVGCADTTAPFDCVLPGQGTVSLQADGSFSFIPEPGDADATATFQYMLTGNVVNVGTVTLTRFERVWYVDPTAGGGGDGTSASPLNSLNSLDGAGGAGDSDVAGDYIFVHDGTLALAAPMELEANQHLVGEGEGLSIPVNLNGNGSPTVLVAAGTHPQLTNAAGDAVTATEAVPVEIVGLSLQGSSNAIDLTTNAALTGSGTLTIDNNIIRGASTEGIDVTLDAGTSGTLNLAVTTNSWAAGTHTGNAVDINRLAGTLNLNFSGNTNIRSNGTAVVISGGAVANTTITGFSGNSVHGSTLGAGVVVSNATFDANTSTGGFQQVDGDNLAIGVSGNPVGGAGMALTTVQGNLFFDDMDIYAAVGTGLQVTGTGGGMTFAVTPATPDGSGTSVIDADSGAAVEITSATIDLRLDDLESNTSGSGVALSTVGGQFRAPSGSQISKTSGAGTAFSVSSSSATVNYAGTLNVTSGSGVSLTSNTGAVNFTGQLTLNTGTTPAFSATGSSGTVTATHADSTLTTTTATALNVNGPDIGAGGLVFRSIAANGAPNGIVLQDTGATAGLTVNGTGTTDGSGGTIQNISGRGAAFINARNITLKNMNLTNTATSAGAPCGSAAVVGANTGCNAAIHLNGVTSVTLDNLNVTTSGQQGINGIDVTGFTLTNGVLSGLGNGADEDGLHFLNMLGTSNITNTSITGSGDDNVNIQNRSSTASTINITGGSFNAGVLGSGLLFGIRDSANTTINISGVTSDNNFSGGIVADGFDTATLKLDVTGSTITNNNDGIQVSANNGTSQFDIDNNDFIGNDFLAVTLLKAAFSTGGALEGAVRNNNPITIGNGRTTDAISVFQAGGGALEVAITNNTFSYAGTQRVILVQAGQDGNGSLDATITGNAIDIQLDGAGNAVAGVLAQSAVTGPGVTSALCLDIGGAGGLSNTFTHSLGGAIAAGDIRVRQRNDGTVRLPGYAGGATDTGAVVTYLSGRNTVVSAPTATFDSTGFAGGGACTQPTLP